MAASKSTYWMVLGKGRPSFQHTSEGEARAEAERLAKADPGQKFVVLKAEAEYVKQPDPVDRTELVGPKRGPTLMDYAYMRGGRYPPNDSWRTFRW